MTERDLFLAALDLPPADRPAFVAGRCGPDDSLCRRVGELLAAHAAADRFLEQPAAGDTIYYDPPADARPAPERAGDVLAGRYHLVRELGQGGVGTVWAAVQTDPVRRPVAVKLVKAGMDTARVLARFEQERQAVARMDHPSIAKVFDAGTTAAGRPFFVMELVAGPPLTRYCDARRLGVADRLRLFVHICAAVQHAHQKGIIHRDLKPGNILVAEVDGRPVPKVIDFGLAKALGDPLGERADATLVGGLVGTPQYMAPEQAGGEPADVDTRADVYALGAVLYELLAGTPPLDRKTLEAGAWDEILRLIREQEPPPPSRRRAGPRELDWVVMKALAKQPDRRYESATAFGEDVARFLRQEPVAAGPPSAWYRGRKFLARNRRPVTAAAAVLLTLATGTIGTALGLVEARRQLDAARVAERGEAAARQKAEREHADAVAARAKAEGEADGRRRVFEFLQFHILVAPRPAALGGMAQGKEITVIEAVERAERRIADEFRGQPVLEAAVRFPIANTYMWRREWAKAADQHRLAHQLRRDHLGPAHPDTLSSLKQLARATLRTGDAAAAAPLFRQALDAAGEADDPRTLEDLAEAYWQLGRPADAVPLLNRSLAMRVNRPQPDAASVRTAVRRLADCYLAADRPDAGSRDLSNLLRALDARDRPAAGPRRAVAVALARLHREAGRPDLAWPLAREAVRSDGPAGPDAHDGYRLLVDLARLTGHTADAEAAVRDWERTAAADSADYGPALLLTGRLHQWAGRLPEATAAYQTVLDWADAKGVVSPVRADANLWLGEVQLAAGRVEDARERLAKGHARAKAMHANRPWSPDDRRRLTDALDARIRWADTTGRRKLASDLRAERAPLGRELAPAPRAAERSAR